jgi:hyperosmotically inducible protein
MKYVRSFLILAVAILGFSSFDARAQDYTNPTGVSQQTLEKKVYKEIIKMPYYGAFDHIAFKVEGDTVTLFGSVIRPITKQHAGNRVKDIAGVSRVINNIEVLPLSSFDDSIRYRTLQTFSNTGGLYRYFWEPNPQVRIIVKNGNVSLEGYVANRGDYNLMNILANGVTGVFNVQNNLIIEKENR